MLSRYMAKAVLKRTEPPWLVSAILSDRTLRDEVNIGSSFPAGLMRDRMMFFVAEVLSLTLLITGLPLLISPKTRATSSGPMLYVFRQSRTIWLRWSTFVNNQSVNLESNLNCTTDEANVHSPISFTHATWGGDRSLTIWLNWSTSSGFPYEHR